VKLLYCTGEGRPAVVLSPGGGDFSFVWYLVEQQVSKFARVCSYDRADSAWSDPGPYVVVGHSMGGLAMRVFAERYASATASMVLVDATSPDTTLGYNGKLVHMRELAKDRRFPTCRRSQRMVRRSVTTNMKKLLSFFAFLSFQAAVLYGQTLTGTWQGVLKQPQAPNEEERVVIRVSTVAADKLAATMYFINDRESSAVSSSAMTANGTAVKMSFDQNNGTWEGRLSTDGKTLDGAWTQLSKSTPLVLTRATAETAWTIPDPRPPRQMMDPKAAPGFEVATVKPSNPDKPGSPIRVNPSGTITTLNTTLFYLVKFAYDLHPKQVIGAPAWIDADQFDITAKPDLPGSPNFQQLQLVLQKVMAERFGLVFHKEKRELSAYTITVAKGGGKIRKDEGPGPSFASDGNPQHGLLVRNATMAEFVSFLLLPLMDLPVVDQTGFGETRYTFTLKFTPDPGMLPPVAGLDAQPPASDADPAPDIFAAMEQQLGLHIQKTKAQVDVMVIDKVSKPSEN
jgi:uncharacterized protein (TIGR03435 family)